MNNPRADRTKMIHKFIPIKQRLYWQQNYLCIHIFPSSNRGSHSKSSIKVWWSNKWEQATFAKLFQRRERGWSPWAQSLMQTHPFLLSEAQFRTVEPAPVTTAGEAATWKTPCLCWDVTRLDGIRQKEKEALYLRWSKEIRLYKKKNGAMNYTKGNSKFENSPWTASLKNRAFISDSQNGLKT